MADRHAEHFKRVNVLVRPDQHQKVMSAGLKMSGLIRDLLDDHFSEEKIVGAYTDMYAALQAGL